MKRTVMLNNITPNTVYFVQGKLNFSRLITPISGEALEKDIRRRESLGAIAITEPYTTATITDARVLYMDPANKTDAEIYAEESIYSGKASPRMFTANNKGKILPKICRMTGNDVYEVKATGELATGLDVILAMRVFKGKAVNQGVSLDAVIVLGEIQYYNGANQALGDALAGRNINYHALNAAVPQQQTEAREDIDPNADVDGSGAMTPPANTSTIPAAVQNSFGTAEPVNNSPFNFSPNGFRKGY